MKYELEFDNNSVETFFIDLYHAFEQSEDTFTDGDLTRNIVSVITFENLIRTLRLFGTDTVCRSYNNHGFMRIGYARINSYEFIKNGAVDYKKLKDALRDIAHPAKYSE